MREHQVPGPRLQPRGVRRGLPALPLQRLPQLREPRPLRAGGDALPGVPVRVPAEVGCCFPPITGCHSAHTGGLSLTLLYYITIYILCKKVRATRDGVRQ